MFAGFSAPIGRELYVEDEKKIDMATAVSGSGPGYVFLFIEAMIEGAVAIGLTRKQAEEMVLQTVLRLGGLRARKRAQRRRPPRDGDITGRHHRCRPPGARTRGRACRHHRVHPGSPQPCARTGRRGVNHQLASLLSGFLYILIVAVIVRSLLSWFPNAQNNQFGRLLAQITDPLLQPVAPPHAANR